ncbi:hypothetical protein EDM76_10595 [bacterium]|nr:MAG: hypothetical protein EDM76_10595 [bacterium]
MACQLAPRDDLDNQKAAAISKGIDVIDLGVGDPDRPTPDYIIDVLCEIAAECGLDSREFQAEAALGRYAELIDRTTAIARQKGVTSTPTMIFDDRVVVTGAQDYLVYEDLLRRLGARRLDESPAQ